MNRSILSLMSFAMCVALASLTLAQTPPPQPEGGPPQGQGQGGFGGPGPGGFNQNQGGGGFGGGGGGGGGGGRGARGGGGGGFDSGDGPRGRGRGGPGLQGPDAAKFEMLRGYIEVVDRYTAMTRSADSAGVAAVISASDILRQRGPEAATEYLTKLLPDVKIPAVERAIRIQLSDLYRQSGQADKALEHLSVLMKATP